jgi:hypothetical protein
VGVDAGSAGSYSWYAALGWCGYFRHRRRFLQEAQQVGSGRSAQKGFFAAGENGRHIARQGTRGAVSNPVDASVNRKEKPSLHSALDRIDGQSCFEKLFPRYDPVIATSYLSDLPA